MRMHISIRKFFPRSFWYGWLVFFCGCKEESTTVNPPGKEKILSVRRYLNLSDTARYVGMEECRTCHASIVQTFLLTGMGKSWKKGRFSNSTAEKFPAETEDKKNFFSYRIFHRNDSLWMEERSSSPYISYHETRPVGYIVGSGQHTHSHLYCMGEYLYQMPMTWYAQKKIWDFPPGFEVVNSRFFRPIGHECITCHNAYPQPVLGSENKYKKIPEGIDCERCHGPGSIHVQLKKQGIRVDTSREIDYSIVNPSKLPLDLQMDICQRCHLQGNAVLAEEKTFYDFRPGMPLSEVMTIFLPRYSDSKNSYIMASHADRIRQSACFRESNKGMNPSGLKPYRRGMTCITCHNPHVSVQQTRRTYFNEKCMTCHPPDRRENKKFCSGKKITSASDCISCHMPDGGSTDIPHVSVHDHYIRKPEKKNTLSSVRTFLSLISINHAHPDSMTRALGFIQQFEKFEQRKEFLDSAENLLSYTSKNELLRKFHLLVNLHFLKKDYRRVTELTETLGIYTVLDLLKQISFSNRDAWTAYRIGESFLHQEDKKRALEFFRKSHELAPFVPEFHAKYAYGLVLNEQVKEGLREYELLARENPHIKEAHTNAGFLYLGLGNTDLSFQYLQQAFRLDPNDEMVLLNLAAYYSSLKNFTQAEKYIRHLLKIQPRHEKARRVLDFILQQQKAS